MILHEIFGGERNYGGEGRGFFTQRFYVSIAYHLHALSDAPAREYLTNWFVDIFKRDNSKFKESLFRNAVERGGLGRGDPQFEQRHFYYLAHHVKAIPDENVREFVCDWLGGVIGKTNRNFLPMRWRQACGLAMTPEQEKQVNRPRQQRDRYNDDDY